MVLYSDLLMQQAPQRMRVTEAGDEEEEDVRAAFWKEVLAVLSRLVSRVERIVAVVEGMEFRGG